ncbi:MAG: hypothetical protein RIC29_03365 [Rhodospirillaceae bacterium]
MKKIAPLESLFHKLGDLRTTPRKGVVMVVMRAAGCITGDGEVDGLTQNLDLVLKRLTENARGEVYRLHTLDYAFLLNETEAGAREFIPNLRVALFKIMSRLGAGQGKADGDGLILEHYKLETSFADAAKLVIGYIKAARELKNASNGQGQRLLTQQDLKAVIDAYRELGSAKFLQTYARGQKICVTPEKGPIKSKMTEYFISIDLLSKPFFEGVNLKASGDRFVELTKILDSIMLNSFETLSKAVKGQPISINLNIPSIFSKAFDNFIARTPPEIMRTVVVEFTQEDVVLNYDGYAIARDHLRSKGAQIAIDQISPSAIGLVNIDFLEAQMAKLHWQEDAEDELYDKQEFIDKLRRLGIRPVLSRVDQERARDVGADLGIEMYQGFLIDSMIKQAKAVA